MTVGAEYVLKAWCDCDHNCIVIGGKDFCTHRRFFRPKNLPEELRTLLKTSKSRPIKIKELT